MNACFNMFTILCNTIICSCILFDGICTTDVDENDGVWYDIPIKGRAVGGPKFGKVGIVLSEVISLIWL